LTDVFDEAENAEIQAHAPMQRWGQPSDMAGAALYLASKAGVFLSGAVIPVDGGLATTA
jgi:NAD(P)-dependent dehydrogenase (short-subunit alcohol dehydrogenase family)